MIDNCYCEFVSKREPLEVGADVIVGSLIKNLGGGIAPNGAYIAGRKDLVELAAERLTVPGEGKGVGDDRLAARAVPVFGEAFQLVNDFILIGCHVVGGGEFDAEHGLVSIQGDFLCMA